MVRVGPLVVRHGFESVESGLQFAKGQRDVRRPEGRDHLDSGRLESGRPVETQDGKSLDKVGSEIIDRVLVLGVVGGQPEAVPVRVALPEGFGLGTVTGRVVIITSVDGASAGCEVQAGPCLARYGVAPSLGLSVTEVGGADDQTYEVACELLYEVACEVLGTRSG